MCASTCGHADSCRCSADTYQNMAEAVAKSWTRRHSNIRGHKSVLSHLYDSAEAWGCVRCLCCVYIKSTRKLRPSPKSSGLLRRCLLMHADLAQAMQADKLRGFAVDAAGYCVCPCKSISSQRPLGAQHRQPGRHIIF